jgi:hypothetical protein
MIQAPLALPAQAQAPGAGANATVPTQRKTLPLSQFSTNVGPLRLNNATASADLFVPLSDIAKIDDATIDLTYTNSIALVAQRSALSVRFNETTLAQVRLDPNQPTGSATIRLPRELWRPGYNKITLAVIQHYTNACEDPESPELWTEIDLSRSHLSYQASPAQDLNKLSNLAGLFSPGLGSADRVLFLTAPSAKPDRLRSEALPWIAQALALRRQFSPLLIDDATWRETGAANASALSYLPDPQTPPMVHALVGTSDQLSHILAKSDQPVIAGPTVIMNAVGKGDARLIVTGRTEDEVIAAARTLTVMSDPLTPASQATFLNAENGASISGLVDRAYLKGDNTYTFASLGVPDTEVKGIGATRIRVPLIVPSDFYTDESAQADVLLNFGYGAGMGSGSVLNMTINGETINGLLLNNPNGAAFHNYLVHIPVRLMVPGTNNFDFNVTMQPIVQGECRNVKGDYMTLQVMGSSTITLPKAGHAAVLPDLVRFSTGGFPFVAVGGDSGGRIVVASPDLVGSALTLIGKLAQAGRAPVAGWTVEIGMPQKVTGRAIILAPNDALLDETQIAWTTAVGKSNTWPYEVINDLESLRASSLTLGTLHTAIFGSDENAAEPRQNVVVQKSDLGDLGILAAFRNPDGSSSDSLVVITAKDTPTLERRVGTLVQPELWGQLKGDLVAWTDIATPMFSSQVATSYEVGSRNFWLMLRLTLSNNPWYWLGGVLVALAIVVVCATMLLKRRRARLEAGGP